MNHRLLLILVVSSIIPAPALAQSEPARDNINALIEEQAKANGVPSSFVHQVVKRESNYNPNARGGSALGLMQIKHATARGMGYRGDASGLYDPRTNLRYGIAYLAGAYKTAKGNLAQAYTYYNRGYYFAAKRQGIDTLVAGIAEAPGGPQTSTAFGDAFTRGFGLRTGTLAGPNITAASTVLAYAPSAAMEGVPTERVEVPLPPRRPAFLSDAVLGVAILAPAPGADLAALSVAPPIAPVTSRAAPDSGLVEAVEVPLPPRRPSAIALASVGRPIVARKPVVPGTILEASAIVSGQ